MVAGELDGSRVAEAAVLGALPEADCCAVGFQAVAQPLAGSVAQAAADARLADAPAARVLSAEFPAHDYSAATLVAPEDDCSRDACPDTAEAAALGPGLADLQMVDVEPAGPDDHYRQERCEFPEEQDGCQEHRAEEHCHSDDHRG